MNWHLNGKIYNGSDKKVGVRIDGVDYIAKFPECWYTEYIASNIMKNYGLNCHTVLEGNDYCLIRDFTSTGTELKSFLSLNQSSVDTELDNKTYSYEDVIYIINNYSKLIDKEQAIVQFWDMFIFDAVLANRDRHGGNWGFLVNEKYAEIAPIYDNGGCLFPSMKEPKLDFEFLSIRSDYFPASLLKINGKRTNYKEVLQSGMFEVLNNRLKIFDLDLFYKSLFKTLYSSKNIPDNHLKFYLMVSIMRCLHFVFKVSLSDAYNESMKLRCLYEKGESNHGENTTN